MGIEPIFVSVQEAADALNISRWPMQQLLREGKVKSTKQGRRRVVYVDSLRAYAASLADSEEAAS